ncbi:MAG TPA: HAMP domain-containing sensor histidine kinase, partial [Phototrophicaceae bacterium]|nr:HAMP domain-containing sensor histidine kinase [Phototrophicaceae bacterium]
IEQHSASASRKDITLLIGKDEGVIQADNHRMVQIIGNLVSNAVKYSPPQHFVTVSSEILEGRVRISVADEGPGISPDERKNLFKAFSKLSNKPTGGETSSGLGLWIVKELVDLHGGEVGVDCPPDGGSIFWVELPVHVPAAKATGD